jgi:hypothetical protein
LNPEVLRLYYPVKPFRIAQGAPFESSGDHLHLGLVPFDMSLQQLEARNGFNGNIDATTYFTGSYAVDYPAVLFP